LQLKPQFYPDTDHRKAVLSLRWMLIILASYLTLFTYLGTQTFPLVFIFALTFAASNVALTLVPSYRFTEAGIQRAIAVMDLVFFAVTFYLLRVAETYLYIAFVGVLLLAVLWRDLRLVLFSVFLVSVLFGVFNYFRLFNFLDVNIQQFLTLALFFVAAIFYVFLLKLLTDDARRSSQMQEENRIAGVMVEITKDLSSSLKSDDVLFAIAHRLREVLLAEECSIIRVDPKTGLAQILIQSSDRGDGNKDIDLEKYPELKQAYETRKLLFVPDARPCGLIALPMLGQEDVVLGLIYIRSTKLGSALSETMMRLFEVMAGTAANAFRNAQLFEEVEHRARTDFLTGLPNHRFFQTTLSQELGRAQRHNHPLSLLIVDLDFLKEVNDRFGHPSGDIVIRTIAETIRSSCRDIDFAARYGGEEFTVILPETPLNGAIQVADRIRERIAAQQFVGIGSITASIGVSNYPVNALGKEDLIRVADQALYVAKNGGRDRVAYFNYQMITR
jgi:diguanylate cyclase (GGDEF)-like protein